MGQTFASRSIRRLLIANRGEIACRIMRTARQLGMTTVAVFSDADRDAPHVMLADEAHHIGPAEAALSYLNQDALFNVAHAAGADAVHPGYGFLSENASFAERCQTEGLIFVGPPPAAIRAMGEKAQAKALMEKAGVPLVPGYHGADQSPKTLREMAAQIGYPVLIKASAGGGGKGMKVVESAAAFDASLESAEREAQAAFGDDRVLIEKYLTKPRHVEVQIFADTSGHCIHLYDRDCSVQRRHQKVVEEAPAPDIPDAVRAKLHAAAVDAAKAIGYVGAGTVEFLYDASVQKFYFMEMNTRLQVEHPVTEAITGIDLVAWQLQVAAGEPLPLVQNAVTAWGHAVEARLYAEDPDRDFLPQTGRITQLILPEPRDGIRIDSGIAEGNDVSIHYDPLLAKLIAWGPNRIAAVAMLERALVQTHIGGLMTNIGFLGRILAHREFRTAAPDTGFISRNRQELEPPEAAPEPAILAAAAGILFSASAAPSGDPWHDTNGWRLNAKAEQHIRLGEGMVVHHVTAQREQAGFVLSLPHGRTHRVSGQFLGNTLFLEINGVAGRGLWLREGQAITVTGPTGRYRFLLHSEVAGFEDQEIAGDGAIRAPMPGRITALLVKAGDEVAEGQTLVVIEAMKMENAVKAPRAGRIAALHCGLGEQVEERAELIVLEGKEA